MLPLGGLHVKHAVQCGIWVATQHFLWDQGKPWSSWPIAGPSRCKLTSCQQSDIKYTSPNINPYLCCFFFFCFKTFISCFYKHFYLYIIWISTKPCTTSTEGMNVYLHKYTYICDSLIIGNFGNPLYFVEIGYYTRFVAHPMTKIMFYSLILLSSSLLYLFSTLITLKRPLTHNLDKLRTVLHSLVIPHTSLVYNILS
jgi:hypothetical protein